MDFKITLTPPEVTGSFAREVTSFRFGNNRYSCTFICTYRHKKTGLAKTLARQMKTTLTAFICNENEDVAEVFNRDNKSPYKFMGLHYELQQTMINASSIERISLDCSNLVIVIADHKTLQAFCSVAFDGSISVFNRGNLMKKIIPYNHQLADIAVDTRIIARNTADSTADIVEIEFAPVQIQQ